MNRAFFQFSKEKVCHIIEYKNVSVLKNSTFTIIIELLENKYINLYCQLNCSIIF